MTTSDEVAAFCHDHIEHPLMWCEEKKRLVERRIAEESLRMWRRKKAEEFARREREKQEYYELFLKHYPWGRPGGGAPNLDIRRKDLTAVGLHSTPSVTTTHRLTALKPCRYSDYFSKHKRCHDPLSAYHQKHHHHQRHHRSVPSVSTQHPSGGQVVDSERSGDVNTGTICKRDVPTVAIDVEAKADHANDKSVEITLKDHQTMSFRNRGHVDIQVLYRPPAAGKGKPILEKIVVTGSDKCTLDQQQQQQQQQEQQVPQEKTATKGAERKEKLSVKLGKPSSRAVRGQAGPDNKPSGGAAEAAGGSFMKSLGWTNREMLKDLDQDNPATPAEKLTFRKPRLSKKPQRCCDLCTCTCPVIAMTAGPLKPLPKKNLQQTAAKLSFKADGRGCPPAGRPCQRVENPETTTDNSAAATATATAARHPRAGGVGNGVELVPLLARRRARNRPISLSSTDVTKCTAPNDRLDASAAELRYLHDLNKQMALKRRSISMSRQLENELSTRHFATFDTFWGRPGHGAPGSTRTKLKLDTLLYGPRDCATE